MIIASLTPMEIIALVLAVFVLLKILILMAKPKLWLNLSGKLIRNKGLFTLVALILVALTGYSVLKNVDIVTVGAVMAFTASLMALGAAPYSKTILETHEKIGENAIRKSWLSVIAWVVLAVWMLYALFV